jgi:16S rRNA C1402 (ribose-2'-O) methylase RsmI
MKVKDLIEHLKSVANQDAEVSVQICFESKLITATLEDIQTSFKKSLVILSAEKGK